MWTGLLCVERVLKSTSAGLEEKEEELEKVPFCHVGAVFGVSG